jgi:hypothetical protein
MFVFLFFFFLLLGACSHGKAQSAGNSSASAARLAERVQQFVREQHWAEVVEAVKNLPDRDGIVPGWACPCAAGQALSDRTRWSSVQAEAVSRSERMDAARAAHRCG